MMMVWGTTIEMDPARTSSRGQIKRKMSKATLVCTFLIDKSVAQFNGLSRCAPALWVGHITVAIARCVLPWSYDRCYGHRLLLWSYDCCCGHITLAIAR